MTQHLSDGIVPLSNEGARELLDLLRRWGVSAPHRGLLGLVSSVVWDELTKHDEKLTPQ